MVMDRTPMHMSMNMINYKFMHTSMADLAAVRDHNGTAGKAAAGSATPNIKSLASSRLQSKPRNR